MNLPVFVSSASSDLGAAWALLGIMLFIAFVIFILLRAKGSSQMEIKLDKTAFALGEPITGTILLNLDKAKAAKDLKASLHGIQRANKSSTVIYQYDFVVAPGQTFTPGESFRFSIPIPMEATKYYVEIARSPSYDNQFERMKFDITRATPPRWYVGASLNTGFWGISQSAEVSILPMDGSMPVK